MHAVINARKLIEGLRERVWESAIQHGMGGSLLCFFNLFKNKYLVLAAAALRG